MKLGVFYVQLIFLVNMCGFFLWKKKGITIANALQNILGS